MSDVTKEQLRAGIDIVLAVSEAIRTIGTVPSGVLYARSCMNALTVDQYNQVIGLLKRAGLVAEEAHVLRWVGPQLDAKADAEASDKRAARAEKAEDYARGERP